jgi:hypothetical protein
MNGLFRKEINMHGQNPTKQTQDWQLEAYEMKGRHNFMVRHQHVVNEIEMGVTNQWGRKTNHINTK